MSDLDSQILNSNIIVLLYDLTVDEAQERIKNFWLPKISVVDNKVPIIIVGTKKRFTRKRSRQQRLH